ncbi:Qat anti-phage system TatD family nuclease QatD [Xanthomonas arboricola]|uniref:Qat anti-phage system TatD family nuclease QatD n=1 Tax=Xanthomonas arboricola TaxID=56448 RepID=UPI004040BB1F
MPAPAVDMHCHLDLYPDPGVEVERAGRSGAYVLSVTTTPSAWIKTRELASRYPRIKTALGLHPQLAGERIGELSLFDRLLPEARYVGEVGLDGGSDCREFWSRQVEVFHHVLKSCADQGGRILTIHSRNAATEVMNALDQHKGFGVAILHWFSGTKRELARAIEMDCWFSVGSAMVSGAKGRELVKLMPPARILTETDGPFAKVRGRALAPAQCDEVIRCLAETWGMSLESAAAQVVRNLKEIVSL